MRVEFLGAYELEIPGTSSDDVKRLDEGEVSSLVTDLHILHKIPIGGKIAVDDEKRKKGFLNLLSMHLRVGLKADDNDQLRSTRIQSIDR